MGLLALSAPPTPPSHLQKLVIIIASIHRATAVTGTIEVVLHALSLIFIAIP